MSDTTTTPARTGNLVFPCIPSESELAALVGKRVTYFPANGLCVKHLTVLGIEKLAQSKAGAWYVVTKARDEETQEEGYRSMHLDAIERGD